MADTGKTIALIKALSGGGGSGGGGVLVVAHITIEPGEDFQDVYVCDMTVDEIQAAQNNGKTVFGVYDEDGLLSIWGKVREMRPAGGGDLIPITGISFDYVNRYDGLLVLKEFSYRNVDSSDVLELKRETQYTLTPAT